MTSGISSIGQLHREITAQGLPNSRPISPSATTVARATSAGHTGDPGTDTPNSLSHTSVSS